MTKTAKALMLLPLFALALLGGMWWGSGANREQQEDTIPVTDCDSQLGTVVQGYRSSRAGGSLDSDLERLGATCSAQYEIATDYFSYAGANSSKLRVSCGELGQLNIRDEAVALIREDGTCSEGPALPPRAIAWNSVRASEGSQQRVCGPLKSIRGTPDGVFVNVGRDYPSPFRFTFVLWGDWEIDPIAIDTTVCAEGVVYSYEMVRQMEISDPSALSLFR